MKSKLMKRFFATAGILACSLCMVITPAATIPVEAATAAEEESISPRSYSYEWVYRIIDGKKYKRLFNKTTQEWVGEWIYIGEA